MDCIYHKMMIGMTVGLLVLGLASDGAAQVRRSFDPERYFQSLDRNGDRRLDKNELNPRALAYLKKIGAKTEDDRISLRSISKSITKNKEATDEQATKQALLKDSKTRKVPGFGVEPEEFSVNRFGADGAEGQMDFSDSTIERVATVLRRYDRNGDNIIDEAERRKARWGRPDPSESDLNRDGLLTRNELMQRYHVREQEQERQQTDSKSDRNSRRREDYRRRNNDDDDDRARRSNSRSAYSSSRSTKNITSAKSKSQQSTRDSGAYEKYAKSLIKRYDKDGDNKLSKEEWKGVRRGPENADKNRDGFVTEREYAAALQAVAEKRPGESDAKKSSSKKKSLASVRATAASKAKSSGRGKSGSKGGAGDFSKLDKDKDNQVQMHEYSSSWDDKKLKEFYKIDTNRDGVITSTEWKSK